MPNQILIRWQFETGEYIVKSPDGTYFTNDVEDAYGTAKLEAKRFNHCPIIMAPTVMRRLRKLALV